MLGCIRYQYLGDSELLVITMEKLATVKEVGQMSAKDVDRMTLLTESQLETLAKANAGRRLVLRAGFMCQLPAGVVVAERTLNGAASHGVKMSYAHPCHMDAFSFASNLTTKTYKEHPHMPQMTIAARHFGEIAVVS